MIQVPKLTTSFEPGETGWRAEGVSPCSIKGWTAGAKNMPSWELGDLVPSDKSESTLVRPRSVNAMDLELLDSGIPLIPLSTITNPESYVLDLSVRTQGARVVPSATFPKPSQTPVKQQ